MDKRAQTCCFTGHRVFRAGEQPAVQDALEACVCRLYREHGVRYFGAGGALGFDMLAAETVLRLRDGPLSALRLILVLPCADQADRWRTADRAKYELLKERADKTVVLAGGYAPGVMQARNRYLVEHSGWCVCYQYKAKGGTAYTVDYARRLGLPVFNCAAPGWA